MNYNIGIKILGFEILLSKITYLQSIKIQLIKQLFYNIDVLRFIIIF